MYIKHHLCAGFVETMANIMWVHKDCEIQMYYSIITV